MTTPPSSSSPAMREVLEQVKQALETARAGLQWYQDMHPEDVDGSDYEADEEIRAALSSVESLAPAIGQQAEQVPDAVMVALNRMCEPLHPSVLRGATAQADAACMKIIRDYILRASPVALQQQEAGSGWRPIKGAPRNGTNILLRFGSDGVSQGKYIPGVPYPWQFIDTNDGITWLVNAAVDGPGGPSHWQPMPSVVLACAPSPAEPAEPDGANSTDGVPAAPAPLTRAQAVQIAQEVGMLGDVVLNGPSLVRFAERVRAPGVVEGFACPVCGQPNAQHHPACPRNAGVAVCPKGKGACADILPDKRCFDCADGVPGTDTKGSA